MYRLTSEDVDLLARDLTQKVFDEVVGHGEKFGGCRKTIILARRGWVQLCVRVGKMKFTFNDEQSFQTFWVVVFKHLEDLVTQNATQMT